MAFLRFPVVQRQRLLLGSLIVEQSLHWPSPFWCGTSAPKRSRRLGRNPERRDDDLHRLCELWCWIEQYVAGRIEEAVQSLRASRRVMQPTELEALGETVE